VEGAEDGVGEEDGEADDPDPEPEELEPPETNAATGGPGKVYVIGGL